MSYASKIECLLGQNKGFYWLNPFAHQYSLTSSLFEIEKCALINVPVLFLQSLCKYQRVNMPSGSFIVIFTVVKSCYSIIFGQGRGDGWGDQQDGAGAGGEFFKLN